VHSIMTSHPLYPNLDPTPRTRQFSRKMFTTICVRRWVTKASFFPMIWKWERSGRFVPIGEAAVQTVQAGHDIVLSCHDLQHKKAVFARCSRLTGANVCRLRN